MQAVFAAVKADDVQPRPVSHKQVETTTASWHRKARLVFINAPNQLARHRTSVGQA
jgi:hypothetical protein